MCSCHFESQVNRCVLSVSVLGSFAKQLRKSTTSLSMSVLPSIRCIEQLDIHVRKIREFRTWCYYNNLSSVQVFGSKLKKKDILLNDLSTFIFFLWLRRIVFRYKVRPKKQLAIWTYCRLRQTYRKRYILLFYEVNTRNTISRRIWPMYNTYDRTREAGETFNDLSMKIEKPTRCNN